MKLHYYRSAEGNFGDDLNAWLWTDLAADLWRDDSAHLFLGIGTIIGNPLPHHDRVTIFSSGVGYSNLDNLRGYQALEIASVRGPLSAAALGLPAEKGLADGALLLPFTNSVGEAPAKTGRAIFIPHHESMHDRGLIEAARLAGVAVVDPRGECRAVIDAIRSADRVIAESMHAAIIADTFGTPWVPVASTRGVSSFKWWDWLLTVGLPFEPRTIRSTSADDWLADRLRGLHGENYFGAGSSLEAAQAAYRNAVRFRARQGWEARRDWRKRQIARVTRLGKLPGPRSLAERVDRQLVEGAARDLAQAVEAPTYLSEPARRQQLGEQLLERLSRVARANGGRLQ